MTDKLLLIQQISSMSEDSRKKLPCMWWRSKVRIGSLVGDQREEANGYDKGRTTYLKTIF